MKDKLNVLRESDDILNMQHIELGDTVKDKIVGFTGVATGRREWLGQKPQIMVEATKLDEYGIPFGEMWFSEERLDKIGG
jgi:hypothetical protein